MTTKTDRPPITSLQPAPLRPGVHILIIESRFYSHIADELLRGATDWLTAAGAKYERVTVPGALEIPQALAAAVAAGIIPRNAKLGRCDGVVALGCVIRGETSHYDIVCNNANHWVMDIALQNNVPVGNGILTVDTEAQAIARARGGSKGKGGDAAAACLRLVELAHQFAGQGS